MTRDRPEDDTRRDDDNIAARASASMWTATDAVRIEPGRAIGPYIIQELLGEGGHGEVYRAEQTEPVQRTVAIKIIKPGMDSKAVIARFEQERQALAVMDHPNVARVLDAGTFLRGVPYFVMDYVDGEPITTYCDRHALCIRDRLALFIDVCDAVQHAHMKGIIHRDLKPSNILVASGDGRKPLVKVIDFGVAKALGGVMAGGAINTEHGQLIGTREYMSPEQAAMGTTDIDTRADVYSLGVVMYELLVGALPFDSPMLRAVGQAQIEHLLRKHEPARPSTQFSTLSGEDGEVIAKSRQTSRAVLSRELHRELDWIPLKAMRAERAERYRSASDLGDDIRNYLRGEPLEAGPAAATYRIGKFVQRHRGPVAAVAMVLLALVAGLIGVSVALQQVTQQREIAQQREQDALAAQHAESLQRERAVAESERARRAEADSSRLADELQLVVDFQASQLSDVDTAAMGERMRDGILSRWRSTGRDDADLRHLEHSLGDVNFTSIALRSLEADVLDRALATIDEQFDDQPLVQARLLQTVSKTMIGLGLTDSAAPLQERALTIRRQRLGEHHPDTLSAMNHMGRVHRSLGNLTEAQTLFEAAWEGRRDVIGEDHEQTLTSLSNLGLVLLSQGRVSDAEPLLRQVLEQRRRAFGEDHPETLSAFNNLGGLMMRTGAPADAEHYFRLALDGRKQVLGKLHPGTLTTMNNLALALRSQGDLDGAELYFAQALKGRKRVFGDDHPYVLQSFNNIALVLHAKGNFSEALAYHRQAVSGRREKLGHDHPATLISISNKSVVLRDLDRLDESAELAHEAVQSARRVLPEDHWQTAEFLAQHSRTLVRMASYGEAERLALEAHAIFTTALGPTHRRTTNSVDHIATLYEAWHKAEPDAGHDLAAIRWQTKSISDIRE